MAFIFAKVSPLLTKACDLKKIIISNFSFNRLKAYETEYTGRNRQAN